MRRPGPAVSAFLGLAFFGLAFWGLAFWVLAVAGARVAGGADLVPFAVRGDAVPAPLGGLAGDAARGEAIVRDRRRGNCLICHALPLPGEPFQGEIGPPLAGAGSRLSAGQIRLRLIDQSRIAPDTVMPPYYRLDGLVDVAPEHRGRPALDAQEIEDVVTYLQTLRGR